MQKIQAQLLDVDYIMVNNKPVIRLFAKTADGQTICAMVEGFKPYFYMHPKPNLDFNDIKYELEKNNLGYEIVEKFLPIGWMPKPVKLFKIITNDPGKVSEIRTFVSRFGTPYEADILFKYRYMVDCGLRGMGWFEVQGEPIQTKTVKCKAIIANSIKPIDRFENAPLRYLAIDIECNNKIGLPNPESDEIIMISMEFHPAWKGKQNHVLIAKPTALEECEGFDDEKAMLSAFLNIIQEYDPDVITGYNCEAFDIPYILKRLEVLKLGRDIGRSEKLAYTKQLKHVQRTTIIGRVIIDPYYIIRHLSVYDQPLRLKRYDLNTVAKSVLNLEKLEIGGASEITRLWNGSDSELRRLVQYSRRDATLAMQLVVSRKLVDMDKFIEMTKLSGLLLQDIMLGQAARHECAILRELKKKSYVMPCKPSSVEMLSRGKSQLKGALVLEPETGLHATGHVLVLDFTALYPSLIRANNICPTTLVTNDSSIECITAPNGARFVSKAVHEGIFPSIASYYLTMRAEVKKQMRSECDSERLKILDAKQYALKGMAVSLYGYTAFAAGRMFSPDVAAAITSFGRQNIENTKKLVESNFPVKVIYGDTDSMFIKTDIANFEEAVRLGKEISQFVTNRLNGLELKFEKVFKRLLIESKKRYAGLAIEKDKDGMLKETIEMKGIETVRRDWCELTTITMKRVLDIILKEGDVKKAARILREVATDIADGKIPIEQLAIVKGVTKPLEKYDGVQPHVELAKKLIKRDPRMRNIVGERLRYVIIKGNALLSKRAEDPDYVKENGLEIDSRYYIENQLVPPLERIFNVCGISRTELLEGNKQKNLFDMLKPRQAIDAGKAKPAEETVLESFNAVTCKKCSWSDRRPPLTAMCPKCNNELLFSWNGWVGKSVKII